MQKYKENFVKKIIILRIDKNDCVNKNNLGSLIRLPLPIFFANTFPQQKRISVQVGLRDSAFE